MCKYQTSSVTMVPNIVNPSMLARPETRPVPILLFHWCLSMSQPMREKNRKLASIRPGEHTYLGSL